MCLLSSFFLYLIISINGLQRKFDEKNVSKVDEELFSFAHLSLRKHFRDEVQIQLKSIIRIQSAVDLKTIRRILTIDFEVISSSDNIIYECPVSIYDDPVGHIRALVRSIICISMEKDGKRNKTENDSLNKIISPIKVGTNIIVEDIGEIDYDEDLFFKFIKIHQKSYSNEKEKLQRLLIFKENLNEIEQLNEKEKGTAIYGITQFTDFNKKEFSDYYLNERLGQFTNEKIRKQTLKDPLNVSPIAFDWRNFSAVTQVKNQGQCGSCWAFSVTGNIEGVWKVKTNELFSLSEQELVDCDKIDEGCNGGYMTVAYDQIIQMNGLMTEDDYKYEGKQHNQCQLDKTKIKVKINSYLNISSDENEMASWLSTNAPISIGLNANMMQFYFRGVAHPHRSFCNPQQLNHGVLLVGYGVEQKRSKSIPFWIIKNSWGEHWGEKGYYRLYRGDGSCGVNLMCSSAIVN